MSSRSAQLRRRHRRIVLWSLAGAAVVHVAAFVLWPGFRPDPLFAPDVRSGSEAEEQAPGGPPTHVELVFGPPDIRGPGGALIREERRLEVEHVLALPPECALAREGGLPARGRVALRVWTSGHADVTDLVESTGTECGDAVMTDVAGALWYRWLPSERFPAPVDLIQPVTLLASRK